MKVAKVAEVAVGEELKRYADIVAALKALEAEKDALRVKIQLAMGDSNALVAGNFKATVTQCERESFDLKKAKTVLSPEIYEPFLRITSYPRFIVKYNGEVN